MDIDVQMNRFLLASRMVFNGFFAAERPWDDPDGAWDRRDLFRPVEAALFQALVLLPFGVNSVPYRDGPQPIKVSWNTGGELPIMINREVDSGYWDYPLNRCVDEADLRFLFFFDWSDIDRKDHRYVMVKIDSWPNCPEVVGKRALIESHYCNYRLINVPIEAGDMS